MKESASHGASSAAVPFVLEDFLVHAEWLGRLARHLMRDGHEAEEVLQDTLAIAAKRGAEEEGQEGGGPSAGERRAWLFGVLKNVDRNRQRAEARRRNRELDAEPPGAVRSASEDAELIERQRELLGCVEELSEGQRRAVLARFYEGTPPREIAAAEGGARIHGEQLNSARAGGAPIKARREVRRSGELGGVSGTARTVRGGEESGGRRCVRGRCRGGSCGFRARGRRSQDALGDPRKCACRLA